MCYKPHQSTSSLVKNNNLFMVFMGKVRYQLCKQHTEHAGTERHKETNVILISEPGSGDESRHKIQQRGSRRKRDSDSCSPTERLNGKSHSDKDEKESDHHRVKVTRHSSVQGYLCLFPSVSVCKGLFLKTFDVSEVCKFCRWPSLKPTGNTPLMSQGKQTKPNP